MRIVGGPARKEEEYMKGLQRDKHDAVSFISGHLELPLPEIRKLSRSEDTLVQHRINKKNLINLKNLILKYFAATGILVMRQGGAQGKGGYNTGQDTVRDTGRIENFN